ncbi:MAG: cupin domain-containing protein [Bacteroidia bacterium]|nr:cupin domain-containing protein [Bacteroidia bacterium]
MPKSSHLFKTLCLTALLVFEAASLSSCKESSELPDPMQAGWKGEKVCEILEDNSDVRILKCTFEPGVGHERHYHEPHFAYALKGSRFQITDSEGVREANFFTGSNYFSNGVEWHEALNIGDSTSVVLIIEPK